MANQLRGKLFGGYDKKQVNTLLSDKSMQYDEALAARQERINALRDENQAMKEELARYRAKEQDICGALVMAQQQATVLLEDAKREAEEESHRLVEENKLLYRRTLELFDSIHTEYETQLNSLESIRADVERCAARVRRHQETNQDLRRAFLKQYLVVCDEADQPGGESHSRMAPRDRLSARASGSPSANLGAGDSSVTLPR